ncbi:hypothetical protein LIER_26073 [Lithospermum erythrorhizon]|uniref:Uncharacterized protein n=1 Tax=Lithospermum erythrorhizon TaxID=34254 RepID=A0AAV3RAH6_LITER
MRLPFSLFLNNLLTTINRAPGQLLPIGGWLNVTIFEVACRMCSIEPTISLSSALFSISHKSFQTKFSTLAKRNILAETRRRLHKKLFYAREDELVAIDASKEPQLVDFDDMLMDRPSLFTRVPIVTKTKLRESMIPEAISTSPPTNTIPAPTINPILKRKATVAPSAPPPLRKAKKNAPPPKKKVLARDSLSEGSQTHGLQPTAGVVATPANVVTLDSSTTVSDHSVGHQREASEVRLPL